MGITKLEFSDEEKQNLHAKYSNILRNQVTKENFSKQSGQIIRN